MGAFLLVNGAFDLLIWLWVPAALLLGFLSFFFPKLGRALETKSAYLKRLRMEYADLCAKPDKTDEDRELANAIFWEICPTIAESSGYPAPAPRSTYRLRTH